MTIGCWLDRAAWLRSTSPSETVSRSVLGISMPIADLPGIGLRMRTSAEATAYAMFLESAVTRSTLVAGPSSTSYRVTVGPRVKPVTWASISNCSNTIESASTTRSFATLRVRCGAPGTRRAWSGSV